MVKIDKYENYTGQGWSNGLEQPSVAFGDLMPLSYGDSQSRLHDTANAVYKDKWHREAADMIYRENLQGQKGIYGTIAHVPIFANYAIAQGKNLVSDVTTGLRLGGPLGALIGAIVHEGKYILDMNHRLNSDNLAKERADILALYDTDPLKSTHQLSPYDTVEASGAVFGGMVHKPFAPTLPSVPADEQMYRSSTELATLHDYIAWVDPEGPPSDSYWNNPFKRNRVRPYKPLGRKKLRKNKIQPH